MREWPDRVRFLNSDVGSLGRGAPQDVDGPQNIFRLATKGIAGGNSLFYASGGRAQAVDPPSALVISTRTARSSESRRSAI
jgi:hypothetical protein